MLDKSPESLQPVNNSAKNTDAPPQLYLPTRRETNLKFIGQNIEKVPKADFDTLSDVIPGINESTDVTQKRFAVMNAARPIMEDSESLTRIFKANMRNRDRAASGEPPIKPGAFVHGMPLSHIDHIDSGVFASEFYGGRTAGERPLRLYLSQILPTANLEGLSMEQVLFLTYNKGSYVSGKGNVALVFDEDSDFKNRLPKTPVPGWTKDMMPLALPIGVSAADLTDCIVSDPDGHEQVIEVFKKFPFYVRVIDGQGNVLLTFNQWLEANKKP